MKRPLEITRSRLRSGTIKRDGFSLLELILALAILGATLGVLGQYAEIGVDSAREAKALATARLICQSKLNEQLLNVTAGISPTTVIDAPVDSFDSQSAEAYTYSIEVAPGQLDGMLQMRVTVTAFSTDGAQKIAIYALDRWFIDPLLGLEDLEAEEELAREEIASGGTQ